MEFNVVFIGAGPANISSASSLFDNGFFNFIIIDSGKSIDKRNHNDGKDCVNGVGGAGLFSDGKFSFYPSGTYIWKELNSEKLKKAYQYLSHKFPVNIPEFSVFEENNTNIENVWGLKSYPTIYLDLEQRIKFINNLTKKYHDKFILETNITNIIKYNNYYIIECVKDSIYTSIKTKKIVIGGGRFMPLFLYKNIKWLPSKFKRVELGLRVEGSSEHPFYSISENIDPKFLKQKENMIFKTFCWCRKGETLVTKYKLNKQNIITWSGRSDVIKTKRSNFGFNVVFKNEDSFHLLDDLIKLRQFNIKLSEIDNLNLPQNIKEVYLLLLEQIYDLAKLNSVYELNNLNIMGPTIEGVGYYPETNRDLKIENEDIWIAGDCSGKFRGIISSILSGIYISYEILQKN